MQLDTITVDIPVSATKAKCCDLHNAWNPSNGVRFPFPFPFHPNPDLGRKQHQHQPIKSSVTIHQPPTIHSSIPSLQTQTHARNMNRIINHGQIAIQHLQDLYTNNIILRTSPNINILCEFSNNIYHLPNFSTHGNSPMIIKS